MQPVTDTYSPRQSRLLRLALSGNALFATFCALLMLAAPNKVGSWLGLEAVWIYQAIAAGLLIFAADLVHQATRKRMASWRGLYASMADFAWVGATALLLLLAPGWLSPGGAALLAGVAAVVLLFGVLQVLGVNRLHRLPDSAGHYRHCLVVESAVPAAEMWQVIAQLGAISRHMPMLRRSIIRGDQTPAEGCVRECEDHSGKKWAEECTSFDPAARSFEVRFLCDEPGFPFPATAMRGGWNVNSTGDSSCEVMVWWELAPKPRWMAPLMLPLMAFKMDLDFPKVIASMAAEATGEPANEAVPPPSARLMPRFC